MKNAFTKTIGMLALLLVAAVGAQAQSGIIRGQVTNAAGEALVGATVKVKESAVGGMSDLNGNFELRGLAEGSYTLQVRYTGHESRDVPVTVPGPAITVALNEASLLDEVIVTGVFDQRTRMESSIAITTLKSKEIQRLTPVSAADLLKNVPGVFVNSSLGEIRNTVYSRGVSVGSNDGASGFYYVSMQEDGLPVTNATYANFGPDYYLRSDITLARLEAVRGGTASILGSNAPGGIFNYVSKTGGQKFEGEFAAKFGLEGNGQQPYYRADAWFGGPLNKAGDLTYSLGGFYRYANGARYPGYPMNNGGQLKANLAKHYGKGSLRLYVKYLDDHNAWFEFLPTIGFDDPQLPAGVEQTNSVLIPRIQATLAKNNTNETIDYDSRDKIHSRDRAIGLNWEHRLPADWTIANNLRYSDKRSQWNTTAVVYPFAVDGIVWHAINGTVGQFGTYSIRDNSSGQELMSVGQFPDIDANGNFIGFTFPVLSGSLPGSAVQANSLYFNPLAYQDNHLKEFIDQFTVSKKLRNMSFTGGAFYAASDITADQSFGAHSFGLIQSPRPSTVGITYTDLGGTTYQLTNPEGIFGGSGGSIPYTSRSGMQNQLALFFGHTWEISPKLNFDWGVRYENFRVNGQNTPAVQSIDTTGGTDGNLLTVYDNRLYLPGQTYRFDKSFNTLSYSAGLNYRFHPEWAVYGRYSQGAKAPDMDLFFSVDSPGEESLLDVQAQNIQQVELGIKGQVGRTTLFLTPFYSRISNVYTQVLGQETSDLSSIYSLPPLYNEYVTMGAELEANVNIARGFDVRGVFTLQNSEATKFQTWILNENGREDDAIRDFSGNKTDNAANFFCNITPTYSTDKFFASLTWYYLGKRAANVPNAFELPAYNQFNLGLGYDITKSLRLSANINNLFNQLGVMGWSAPGGFPAALDRQGFTREMLAANPNVVYSTLSIPPRAYFLTAAYRF